MKDDTDDLRRLHLRILDRKPVVSDLPDTLQYVVKAGRMDDEDPALRWFRNKLSDDDWDRIRAAQAEEHRRETEQAEAAALCQRGDEAGLRSMYPGHAMYYDKVMLPPVFEERPVDAVVVIESGAGSLVRKATAILESGMAQEALKVQYAGSPNKYAKQPTEKFFMGYYTPGIEARMAAPRPDCKRLRSNQCTQAACRRDITLSIVRDWLEVRGHRSARFLMTYQASWPHFELLIKQFLDGFDTCIDPNFHKKLSRKTSFLREVCKRQSGPGIWIDYEAYVATLFERADAGQPS